MNPFIVLEALDAGGSQTQTDLLGKRLKKEKYKVHQYHFPQEDRATGRIIYDKFLLYKNKFPFTKREQALLYIQDFYSKNEELWGIISPPHMRGSLPAGQAGARGSVGQGRVLLSDRFATSTMAYQTIGLPPKERKQMLNWITWLCYKGTPALPKPDIVLFLDTPVEISLKRLKGKKKDFFETKDKLTAIRDSYLKLAKEQRWKIFQSVDKQGNQRTREALHAEIWGVVQKVLTKSTK